MIRRLSLIAVVSVSGALAGSATGAQRPVARVLEASGSLTATNVEGKTRPLAVFGTVYDGDRLRLENDSSVVLAFRVSGRLERIKGPAEVSAGETGCTPPGRVEAVAVDRKQDRSVQGAVQQLPPITRGG